MVKASIVHAEGGRAPKPAPSSALTIATGGRDDATLTVTEKRPFKFDRPAPAPATPVNDSCDGVPEAAVKEDAEARPLATGAQEVTLEGPGELVPTEQVRRSTSPFL